MTLSRLRSRHPKIVRGVLELVLILTLWAGYSLSRLFADTAMGPALHRAHELLHIEDTIGIGWEVPLNELFTAHSFLGLAGSYWYASLHYIVTGVVLLWLYRLGPSRYVPARRALVAATILMPTAPPRFLNGYVDVLSLHAGSGWWGGDASAPRGLGGLTNELAAFPSLHAGWALWVAIAVQLHGRWSWLRVAAWAYALGTAIVIVGTGNHWVIDVLMGWLVVLVGWALTEWAPRVPVLVHATSQEPQSPTPRSGHGQRPRAGVE